MKLVVRFLVNTLAIAITSYIVPNVSVDSLYTAIALAVVLALINTVIKPVVKLFTLPINILTLGLFQIFINGVLILLASNIIGGFYVSGLFWAIVFSVVLSFISSILNTLTK